MESIRYQKCREVEVETESGIEQKKNKVKTAKQTQKISWKQQNKNKQNKVKQQEWKWNKTGGEWNELWNHGMCWLNKLLNLA